ncbi:MAG: penicillin-binding protein activator LpoB, partial [Treponema sp.]|nr:penicillin-binding protein activator LpoB [Treponema sp.]
HIVNDGKLTVVDRANLETIRQEMNFQLSGEVSNESMQAIGQKLGAQSIISGQIIDSGAGIRLRIRIISIESAQVPGIYSANLTQDNRLTHLTRTVAPAQSASSSARAPAQPAAASNTGSVPAEFIGTWVNSSANAIVTIETNRLTFINRGNNVTYTIENLSWAPYRNGGNMASTYPAGYAITGTVTKNQGWSNDTSAANYVSGVGTKYADHWYISNDKRSINLGQRNTKERYGTASVYNKQ